MCCWGQQAAQLQLTALHPTGQCLLAEPGCSLRIWPVQSAAESIAGLPAASVAQARLGLHTQVRTAEADLLPSGVCSQHWHASGVKSAFAAQFARVRSNLMMRACSFVPSDVAPTRCRLQANALTAIISLSSIATCLWHLAASLLSDASHLSNCCLNYSGFIVLSAMLRQLCCPQICWCKDGKERTACQSGSGSLPGGCSSGGCRHSDLRTQQPMSLSSTQRAACRRRH